MKMNIEKALRNYLKGSGPRVKYKAFFENASKDPNAVTSVLFDLLNEEVDSMTDTKCLNKTIELINYLKIIISNFDEINRKIDETFVVNYEELVKDFLAFCDDSNDYEFYVN